MPTCYFEGLCLGGHWHLFICNAMQCNAMQCNAMQCNANRLKHLSLQNWLLRVDLLSQCLSVEESHKQVYADTPWDSSSKIQKIVLCAKKSFWCCSLNYSLIQIRPHWTLFNCSKFLSKFLNSPILGWGRPNLMQGKSQRLLNVSKV